MRWGFLFLSGFFLLALPAMGSGLCQEKEAGVTARWSDTDTARLRALAAMHRGDAMIAGYRYKEAEAAFRDALSYFEPNGDCYYEAYCRLWLGEALYGQGLYREALEAGLRSEQVADACPARDTMSFYDMILQNNGVFYSRAGEYEKQMAYYRRAFDRILTFNGRNSDRAADAFYNLGMAHGRRGQWDRAIAYFDTSLHIAQSRKYDEGVANAYASLSYAYGVKEDYARAIDYQEQAMKLASDKVSRAQGLNNLGVLYSDLGDYRESLNALEQSLNIREGLYGDYHDEILSTLLNIARVYFDTEDDGRANQYIDDALNRMDRAGRLEPYYLKVAYHYKALLLQRRQRLAEAENYARRALQIDAGEPEVNASSLLVLGSVLRAQARYDEALEKVQQALADDMDQFRPATVFENPPLHLIRNTSIVLDLLALKAELLQLRGKRDRSQNDLSYSLNTYLLADSIIDYSRRNYQDNTSKELLAANTRELYAGAMAAGFEIFRISSDDAYLDLVFNYAEKTKSLLVLEKIHDLYAKSFYGIPESVVEKERKLLQDIEFYSNQIRQFRDVIPIGYDVMEEWENILFELRREQQDLLEEIKVDYPAYYNLKHDLSAATPDAIRENLLGPEEVLLEYFVAGTTLYIFAIGKEEKDFVSVRLPMPLHDLVRAYRNALVNQDTTFYRYSHALYRLLLEPVKPIITGKNLVVVPDGALGHVPFETLLAAPVTPEATVNHRQLPYALFDHHFRYLFSASLALEERGLSDSPPRSVRVLGIAPSFSGQTPAAGNALRRQHHEFPELHGSEKELRLLRRFAGDTWYGESARESRLKAKGRRYGLLHISTHTLIDERFPSLSKLVLAGETSGTEDGFLHAYELYNMYLPAELVVLSACNTGVGVIKEGEGVVSLARAFAYAGAPNLVMSLWQVRDKTTPLLMARFYEELAAGAPKHLALQRAKRAYLEEEDELTLHPYYWGAFIYAGDTAPLDIKAAQPLVPALPVGIVLVLAGIAFFWRRRYRRAGDHSISPNTASALSR